MATEQMGMRAVKASYGKGVIEYVLQKSRGMVTLRLITKERMNQWGNCYRLYKEKKKKAAKELRKLKKMKGSKNTGLDEVKEQL